MQGNFRHDRGARARQWRIVRGVIGKYRRKFGLCGAIVSCSMKQPAMEKQHITGIQFSADLRLQQRRVFCNISTQELRLIKTRCVKIHYM